MNLDRYYLEKNFYLKDNNSKYLDLSEKQICSIDDNTFVDLNNVEYLWLRLNQLKVLNETAFTGLINLIDLDLEKNQISKFESAFNDLKNLKRLNLSSNKINKLNKSWSNGLENLNGLNLKANQISDLGQNMFKNLKSLVWLSLDYNKIIKLNKNAFNGLQKLEKLHLNDNLILEIDNETFEDLYNLKELLLQNNQIKALNSRIFIPNINLTKLDLSYNQLTELEANIFQNLINLNELNLNHNKINKIKEKAFNGLSKLKKLYFNHNKLAKLEKNNFEGLGQLIDLDLTKNSIYNIEVNSFQNLKNLTRLNLYSNEILQLEKNTFSGMVCLKELNLNLNKIEIIGDESFYGLVDLEVLQIQKNKIKRINHKSLYGLISLKELYLNENQIEDIQQDAFQDLINIEKIHLYSNKLTYLNPKTFTSLFKLKEIEMERNQLKSLGVQTFTGLNLQILYLHPINFNLDPKVFKNIANKSDGIVHLTLFDEFILYKPNFKLGPKSIRPDNLSLYFGKRFSNTKLKTEFFLSSKSLVSIKLNNLKYKSIQKTFKWRNISSKLSVITGMNGVGKTTLLKLIHESLNQEENKELFDYYVIKYFNSAEDKLTLNQNELNLFNKKLNENIGDFLFNIGGYWTKFLYDNINYFSLIQYFDYLVQLNEKFDVTLNNKLFKYSFDQKRVKQRKNQQNKFDQKFEQTKMKFQLEKIDKTVKINKLNYYDGIRSIEFYLGLDEDNHKLSPGESLILLLELWRIHAEYLKQENQMRPFRTKLRIVLLDEPDCHMHPSLIKEFIRLLTNNDLNYLKFQVIMSTHNPVSISFVPLENIFEMKRDQQSNQVIIDKISNKSELIRDVSEDLIFIKEKFKIVFIEGGGRGEDEAFYSLINLIVNKDIYIPIKFQEMGNCQFNQIFIKDINQDSSYKIDEFIFGINDGDYNIPNAYRFFSLKNKYFESKTKNEKFQNNFKRLERYSFENYVYDPINFFFAINHLIKKKLVVLKENQVVSDYIDNVKDFLKEIEFYQNINDFIKAILKKLS